jgi:hypothetical protein
VWLLRQWSEPSISVYDQVMALVSNLQEAMTHERQRRQP